MCVWGENLKLIRLFSVDDSWSFSFDSESEINCNNKQVAQGSYNHKQVLVWILKNCLLKSNVNWTVHIGILFVIGKSDSEESQSLINNGKYNLE